MSAIPDIKRLMAKGDRLPDLPDHLRFTNLPKMAVNAIRAGLKAYFSTYQTVGVSQTIIHDQKGAPEYAMFRQENGLDYLEAYSGTILQLHYGIELAIKELLRMKHPLLASSDLPASAVLLLHILEHKNLSYDDEEKLKSTEFAESLKRFVELEKADMLEGDLSIVVENKGLLSELNNLRNRIIHRGLFVMDYSAFDLAVSVHLLPFLIRFLALKQFKNEADERVYSQTTPPWKYKELSCGIDPIEEIVKTNMDTGLARKRLAFLKELGRAAFQNPLDSPGSRLAFFGPSDAHIRGRAEQLAKHELTNPHPHAYNGANRILKCPVCGLTTLVRFNDGEGYDTGATCTCCTFRVKPELGNARDYQLQIDDFWFPDKPA